MSYMIKNFPNFITNKEQNVFFEKNDIVKIVIKDEAYFRYKNKYAKELHGRISDIANHKFNADKDDKKWLWEHVEHVITNGILLDMTEKYYHMELWIRLSDIEIIELIEEPDDYINITQEYCTKQWLRNKILQKLKKLKH